MEIREEREIRIFDLFISLCQRWRSLLICLVIGAVVFGAYGWYKSGGSGVDSPGAAEPADPSAWEEVLGPDAKTDVDQLYLSIQEYDQLIQENDKVEDLSQRVENMKNISSIQEHISSIRDRFTNDQKAYLEYLMGDKEIVPGKESTYNHKDNIEKDKAAAGGRHINKKYVVVGALLGLILAAIVIIIKYISKTTIKTIAETEDNLGLTLIGRFDGSDQFYDKRKTALDRWLRKVKQKNKQKISYEESTDMVAAKIQIAAKKQNLKKVCIAVDSNVALEKVQHKEFLEDVISKVGTEPEVLILNNILGKSDALHDVAGSDAVILVIQTENSRFMDVQYEHLLCEGYGVPVLGTIVVE